MKAILKKSLEAADHSFMVKELKEAHFDPNWHFHPQYQIFLVLEGTGTRFIGDHIKPFSPGDLVFLGPNLPHLWRSDKQYFDPGFNLSTYGIVIYFTEECLGQGFFDKLEMAPIKQLFEKSKRGIEISGKTREALELQMKKIVHKTGFDLVLSLLSILNDLSHSHDLFLLSSIGYANNFKVSETTRMQKVHDFVMNNFQRNIELDEVATLANMSPSAFCRYFKARANKTFFDFISEIRIGHACKLLIEENLNVTQICYQSGFNTLSNFNRQFKTITGKSPVQYQKEYLQGIA
jgi:AraC-like DNA-binding protein